MFARLNGRQLKRNRTTDEVSGRLPDGWFPLSVIPLLHRSGLPRVHRVEGQSAVAATEVVAVALHRFASDTHAGFSRPVV